MLLRYVLFSLPDLWTKQTFVFVPDHHRSQGVFFAPACPHQPRVRGAHGTCQCLAEPQGGRGAREEGRRCQDQAWRWGERRAAGDRQPQSLTLPPDPTTRVTGDQAPLSPHQPKTSLIHNTWFSSTKVLSDIIIILSNGQCDRFEP